MLNRIFLAALLAVSLSACEKKSEEGGSTTTASPTKKKGPAQAPAQKTRLVKAVKVKGPAESQPMKKVAGSQPMKKAVAGSQPMKAAGSQPASRAAAAPSAGPPGAVEGQIQLSKDLAKGVKEGSMIFIIARRDVGPDKRGMLIAAQKRPIKAADFPLKYKLTQRDVMMQGSVLNGKVRIEARIDQDGDAISKTPGDITGKAHDVVSVGQTGIDFKLDTKL